MGAGFLATALRTTATVALSIVGCVAAAMSLYLLVLSIAASFYDDGRGRRKAPRTRLVVLVPAHNEAPVIGRCVRSLRAQSYPANLYETVVVADNCTDDTAAVALAAGADRVLTRDEPDLRGKGHALRWATERVVNEAGAPAAVAVVDADSFADPDFLTALVQPIHAGAEAVQGESLLSSSEAAATTLGAMAFLLVNRVRPAGRAALGLPATHLAGNGMLLTRELLVAMPWKAFTAAEDLEYSLALKVRGVRIAFAGGALVLSPPAPTPQAASQQQLRWQGGKLHLARTWIPRLIVRALRERRPSLLGTAFDLAVPPLALLAAVVSGGTGIAVLFAVSGLTSAWTLGPWLLALASIPLSVVIGLRAAGAPRHGFTAMSRAPLFVLKQALRAPRLVRFRGDVWVRTERQAGTADD